MRKWLVALALVATALTQTASTRVAAQPVEGVDVPGFIDEAAARAGWVSAPFLHCLAGRESGGDPAAVNWWGNWHGLYQYLPETWRNQSARYGYAGVSVYDGWANAHVTALAIRDHRGNRSWLFRQWPSARWCGSPW